MVPTRRSLRLQSLESPEEKKPPPQCKNGIRPCSVNIRRERRVEMLLPAVPAGEEAAEAVMEVQEPEVPLPSNAQDNMQERREEPDPNDVPSPSEPDLRNKWTWDVMDAYFDIYGPATQHIESFDHFMSVSLPEIVIKYGNFEYEEIIPNSRITKVHEATTLQCKIHEKIERVEADGETKELYPYEARIRNLHYSKRVFATVQHRIYEMDSVGSKTLKFKEVGQISLGDIPIMVKSRYCNLWGLSTDELMKQKEDPSDAGGYFIINGKEKVIMCQERAANNQLFLFKPACDADYQLEAEIRSTYNVSTEDVSALWIRIPGKPKLKTASGQVVNDPIWFDPKMGNTGASSDSHHVAPKNISGWIFDHKRLLARSYAAKFPGLTVSHVALMNDLPLMIMFKALGFTDDRSMWGTLGVPQTDFELFWDNLRSSIENKEASKIRTQDEALIYIGRLKKQSAAERYINRESGRVRVFSDEEYLVRGKHFVNTEVLPHVGDGSVEEDDLLKAIHLGYMVNRLISAYLGLIPCDDRDHLQNKRFDLSGQMMTALVRRNIHTIFEEMRMKVERKVKNQRTSSTTYKFFEQITGSTITQNVLYAFTSGNWGDKRRSSGVRSGVVQPLNRLTGLATLSFLRRISCPVSRLVRMTAPRMVHNTAFGYICPSDTPEGEPVGLLKNLALMSHISVDCDLKPVFDCLKDEGYVSIDDIEDDFHMLIRDTKIFMDGALNGFYPGDKNPLDLVEMLKRRRSEWDAQRHNEKMERRWIERQRRTVEEQRRGLVPGSLQVERLENEFKGFSNQMSIVFEPGRKEIKIRADGGRPIRPLFVVKDNKVKLTMKHIKRLRDKSDPFGWQDLVREGVIEYLDAAEEETSVIAMFPHKLTETLQVETGKVSSSMRIRYTHLEINPSAILGVCASLIPFADHNQSPRVTYQANMAKQAIGIYTLNHAYRYDTEMHVLNYCQKPLVTTKAARFSNYDEFPAGTNAIVAIATFHGYNQEDSLIMNTSAIQRGLFRSTHFKTKVEEARVQKGCGDANETFEIPQRDEVTRRKSRSYENLEEDGFPSPGDIICDENPIVGKTQMVSKVIRSQQEMLGRHCPLKEDVSELYKVSSASKPGHIDSVVVSENTDGYKMVKIKIRTQRDPQMGDKFASRHGQKGVMGMAYHETDMLFTKDGIVPDIIMNPHAIPSRMTIGHLIEMRTSKIAALSEIMDGTCFTNRLTVEEGRKKLRSLGCQSLVEETMYDGATGRKMGIPIFFAPVFYQRLKHMTEDKVHFRNRGPVTALCKQPTSGLQRDGGLRFGEMERDSLLSHGGFQLVRERLFIVSDYYTIPVCRKCGQFLLRLPDPRPNHRKEVYYKCNFCGTNRVGGFTAELPFACKLLFQELSCMNIKVMISAGTDEMGSKLKNATKVVEIEGNCDILSELLNAQECLADYSHVVDLVLKVNL